ncbi:MAG: TCP-1/cpn60 chaperonin family protein [Chloroflexota bacterium]
MPIPAVLQSPESNAGLKRGFDKLARLLALTLGPTQGQVLSYQLDDNSQVEALTDSATIARRMLQFPDRAEDVGAMLLRNLVWRVHLRAGDGGATTAVLAQAILDQAYRCKAAGANPMLLQRGLRKAAAAAVKVLQAMARPVEDEEGLTRVAQTITAEPELSLILGEMFDILGPDGYVTIEDYVAPYLEREYEQGGRFKGRLVSPYLISEPASRRAILSSGPVALVAADVSQAEEVQPLLEAAVKNQSRQLTLIAHEIKGEALNMLVANHQQQKIRVAAIELRRPDDKRRADFEDLAALTGATLLAPELGRRPQHVTAADLGTARRVEADADSLVVVGNPEQAPAIREQIGLLQARLAGLPAEDEQREELRLRIARLAGRVARLKLGAYTKAAREVMRQKANKGLRALPLALQEGVVPGGGVAFLDCIPAVKQAAAEGEEGWGVEMLARALEAPFRCIVTNAGQDSPAAMLSEARRQGPGQGYNALTGEIVNMTQAGIVDAVGILRLALETAVSGAAMAFSTETIVLKRKPETSYEP